MQEYLFKFKDNHAHARYSDRQVHPELAQVGREVLGSNSRDAELDALDHQYHAQRQHRNVRHQVQRQQHFLGRYLSKAVMRIWRLADGQRSGKHRHVDHQVRTISSPHCGA